MKIVLATNNPGKIRELSILLLALKMEFVPQTELGVDDIPETGLSFIENALLKARHASMITGLPALADDSGISVAALNGEPGIHSARFAGEKASASDNIEKLLNALSKIMPPHRQATFHCVLAFVSHSKDPIPLVCDGKWTGTILTEPRGKEGHGYDPIFYIPELQKSAAEIPLEIKNKISHRAIALQTLLKLLPEKLYESAVS